MQPSAVFDRIITSSLDRAIVFPGAEDTFGHSDPLREAQILLFRNGWHSDCIIRCQSYEWKCHKAIICPKNCYFRAALTGSFIEASSSTVILEDDEPWAVECLLYYLYSFQYPTRNCCESVPTTTEDFPPNDYAFDLGIFKIADKREAHSLRTMAMSKVLSLFARSGWAVWEESIDSFIISLPFLWEVPDSSGGRLLREWALKLMVKLGDSLFRMPAFQAVLERERNIATDLYVEQGKRIKDLEDEIKKIRSEICEKKSRDRLEYLTRRQGLQG
ncbi:MAG: hypothetical protein Q9227_002090 [Pyrenula ochraceoflavens]